VGVPIHHAAPLTNRYRSTLHWDEWLGGHRLNPGAHQKTSIISIPPDFQQFYDYLLR
jgi:hypothetical protein